MLKVLFAWPYKPRVQGRRYEGIDMTGCLPMLTGLKGVYVVTVYGILTGGSGADSQSTLLDACSCASR
eukprot:COSAG01_NODE_1003_length_12216_cov_8.565350_19_plen_68_part_00